MRARARPRIISADSHIVEPPDLWQARVPAAFQERAPKIVKGPNDTDAWSFEGGKTITPVFMTLAVPGISPVQWNFVGARYADMRPNIFDPVARLQDMDTDFVYAQVLHPSILLGGPRVTGEHDRELVALRALEARDVLAHDLRLRAGNLEPAARQVVGLHRRERKRRQEHEEPRGEDEPAAPLEEACQSVHGALHFLTHTQDVT